MNKKSSILLLACIVVIVSMTSSVLKKGGIPGYAGSPAQPSCIVCHIGPLNNPGGSVTIASTPAFFSGTYIPNAVYLMNVTVTRKGSAVFGLSVEAINASNTNAGTLTVTNPLETHIMSSGGKKCITHKEGGGIAAGIKTFQFSWTAPAKGAGAATFYVTGLAGDNNDAEGGDYTYTTKLALTEATSTGTHPSDAKAAFWVYPNPAAEKINLTYSLDKNSKVICDICSATGTLVTRLLDEQQNAGIKKMSFTLPSTIGIGIYTITLKTGEYTVSEKLIITD